MAIAQEWVRLKLDVGSFDASTFGEVVTRCRGEGIVLRTMAELGDHDANRRLLYELNRTCSADIPERGEFYSYEEYLDQRIRRDYTPTTTVIALDGSRWVGMSAASDHSDDGYYLNEMTGVIRSHRGRGIALAMKVLVIELIRKRGGIVIRTLHHPANEAPIALNRRLGYINA